MTLVLTEGETTKVELSWVEDDNSTALKNDTDYVDELLEALFWKAKEHDFEDGIENPFSSELIELIFKFGNKILKEMSHFIVYEKINPHIAAEALRWIGKIEHPPSQQYRLWLLETSLNNSSPIVRDGALLGLASMDDASAISFLESAIKLETNSELKKDMIQVLDQLNE
jgi:hypothetical protein